MIAEVFSGSSLSFYLLFAILIVLAGGGVLRDHIWGFNVAAFFGLPFRWSEARAWCFFYQGREDAWWVVMEGGNRTRMPFCGW